MGDDSKRNASDYLPILLLFPHGTRARWCLGLVWSLGNYVAFVVKNPKRVLKTWRIGPNRSMVQSNLKDRPSKEYGSGRPEGLTRKKEHNAGIVVKHSMMGWSFPHIHAYVNCDGMVIPHAQSVLLVRWSFLTCCLRWDGHSPRNRKKNASCWRIKCCNQVGLSTVQLEGECWNYVF